MPYPITKEKDKFCVNGKCYESREKALAYQRALYANVPDAKKKEMEDLLIVEGTKCWDDWDDDYWYGSSPSAGMPKLSPDDPRVAYDPLGGTRSRACANCAWFIAGQDMCQLVDGPIVATGLSGLWLEKTKIEPQPIKVEVVNKEDQTDAGSKEVVKPELAQAFLVQVKELINKITFGSKSKDTGMMPNMPDHVDDGDESTTDKKKKKLPFEKADKEQGEITSGFKNLPNHKWVAFYTNNFQDRSEELFPEAAHDRYLAWVDNKELPLPELWYWHLPVRAGQAEWVGRVDHIMMAVGHYDETPVGLAMENHMEIHHKEYQTSHGYLFPSIAKKDGAFNVYATFEISPLPRGYESNPWTTFEEVINMPIRQDKKEALEAVLGKDLAAHYIKEAENRSQQIEAMGIKFKEVTDGALQDVDARAAVKEVAEAQQLIQNGFKDIQTKIDDMVKQLNTGIKALQDADIERTKRVGDIEKAVKSAFELQPSPRVSNQTAIPEDNPLLVELKKKQLEGSATKLGLFDLFGLSAMANNPENGQ